MIITHHQPRWLLGPQTVAKHSPNARLHPVPPVTYPSTTLRLGADFCDREKLDQREKILHTQKPHIDQHALPVNTGVGRHRWFSPSAYGRLGMIRSVVISPLTGRFQMYYLVHGHLDISARWTGGAYAACYAESHDGIHWTLPELGKQELFGTRENNVIFPPGYEVNVILDPNDPNPERLYKAFLHPGPKVAFSPDGIHWSPLQPALIETEIGRSDGDTVFGWDDLHQRYVAYFRPWGLNPDAPEGSGFKRKIGRAVSEDFLRWHDHRIVLEADEEDGEWAEIERMHVFRHGHLFLGLANLYHGYPEERVAISHMIASMQIELVYSEDGIKWHRFPERTPFLKSLSPHGISLSGGQPTLHNDLYHFYYSSSFQFHGELPVAVLPTLARQDAHRLAGWSADQEGATLETTPFECPGGALYLYADADLGHLRVAVLAEDGLHHIDYAVYRCGYIQGRGARHLVQWQNHADLESLKGKTISLKFYFADATLYGFLFEPALS